MYLIFNRIYACVCARVCVCACVCLYVAFQGSSMYVCVLLVYTCYLRVLNWMYEGAHSNTVIVIYYVTLQNTRPSSKFMYPVLICMYVGIFICNMCM